MQKLLLQYINEDQAKVIRSYLETRLPYEILVSLGPKETEGLLASKAIHLLLYETNQCQVRDLQFFKELRANGFAYPILVMADTIAVTDMFSLAENYRIHILEKPFEFRGLRGITRKLMSHKTVPQQVYRRFRTNQRTKIETYLSGQAIESKMYNLSKGGAYFEFAKRPEISTGDLLRMKITLPDIDREYAVNARVVWTTRKGSVDGDPGCGVRFIKGQELYKQLMEKV